MMKKAQAQTTPSALLIGLVLFSMVVIGTSYFIGDMASNAGVTSDSMHYIETYDYIQGVAANVNKSQSTFDQGGSGSIGMFTGYLQNAVGATKMVLAAPMVLLGTLSNISTDIVPLPYWFYMGVYAIIGIVILATLIGVALKMWW